MSVTFTVHLWWLGAYLFVGVVVLLPLAYISNLQIHQRPPFWRDFARAVRRRPQTVPMTIALWPLFAWDSLEYPVKQLMKGRRARR